MLPKKAFKAPKGKFRVISLDTFDNTDCIEGDFKDFQEAKNCADKEVKGQEMCKAYVYDDKGKRRYETGKY